jgi:glycosyltransferase involved in cell wall biosynthesis
VFLLSRQAEEFLSAHLPPGRVTMLPLSSPPPWELEAAASEAALISPRRPFVLAVGDLYPYKGYEDVVSAIGVLTRRDVSLDLYICGTPMDDAYARRLQKLAQQVAPGLVHFLGPVSHVRVLAFMALALATVMTSRVENTSHVPMEAMSLGSPLVATDISNLRDTAGSAAEYYPPGDPRLLADVLEELAVDETARAHLAERGRREMARSDWLSSVRTILRSLALA